MSSLTQAQIDAREGFLSGASTATGGSPIIGVFGETGTGKTTFMSALMAEPRYRRVLFIDGDRGGATIAHLTSQADLCEYRYPKRATNALAAQQWMCAELAQAHKVPNINAVVVEGVARIYEDLVASAFMDVSEDQLSGHKLRRLYIVPANLTKAVIGAICDLQSQFQYAGRAVPIFFTCNTKERSDDDGERTWQAPSLSDSAIKVIMGRSDAFVQLVRRGNTVSLLTDRDKYQAHRKVRHHGAAAALARASNPNAVTMIQTWADAIAADSAQVAAHLQAQQPQPQ